MNQLPQAHASAAVPTGTLVAEKLSAPTRADRLRALERRYGATSTRRVRQAQTGGDEVIIALDLANGDRIAGRGPTTEAALTHLERRLEELHPEGPTDA